MACMTLGGDPQAAYHAGLLALLYAFLGSKFCNSSVAFSARPACPKVQRGCRHHPVALLLSAAGSGAVFAAVQILPAAEWAGESCRSTFRSPRSVYEIPSFLTRQDQAGSENVGNSDADCDPRASIASGLFGRPVSGTHHRQLYDFSLEPWRCTEFVWPNFSGHLFPRNQRWLSVLGAEGRVWTPSLYFGLAPLLLSLSVWRLRRDGRIRSGHPTARRVRWLSWIAGLGLLGSFGWYGLGWAIGEISGWITGSRFDPGVGAPTGGVYWLMVVGLPGYVYFRYPAKLLVISLLGFAMLGGFGLDRLRLTGTTVFRRLVVGTGLVSLIGGLVIVIWRPLEDLSQASASSG